MVSSFGRTRYRRAEEAGNAFRQDDLRGDLRQRRGVRAVCSIAASGEAQGGWENGKIAALVPGSQAAAGHGEVIRATLRAAALAEIVIYRAVSLAVMAHLRRILDWRWPKAGVVAAGIRGVYAYEQPRGWRRTVSMRMPARRNALGGPVPAQPSHA